MDTCACNFYINTVEILYAIIIIMELACELHKPVRRKFKTRQVMTRGIDHIWEADLLIMTQYSAENDGFKYILNVIDCFSKYAWCLPLKSKGGKEVSEVFGKILSKRRPRRIPELLHCDQGKEFVNATFKNLLSQYNIEMYHTFTEIKASIVERFNRTLNQKMKLYFEVNQNHKWLNILPKLVKQYNEVDVHRTIGMPPASVNTKNEADVFTRMYGLKDFKLPKPTLKVGDRVRIIAYRFTFANKYERTWTEEIFVIDKVHYTVPITYTVRALDGEPVYGKFYKRELERTKFGIFL